jgi:hypothetical protein
MLHPSPISGMVIATIAGRNVMAVACCDTDSLLTLTVNAKGSLSVPGSVGDLMMQYPGIVLDGTNILVPPFGTIPDNGSAAAYLFRGPAAGSRRRQWRRSLSRSI